MRRAPPIFGRFVRMLGTTPSFSFRCSRGAPSATRLVRQPQAQSVGQAQMLSRGVVGITSRLTFPNNSGPPLRRLSSTSGNHRQLGTQCPQCQCPQRSSQWCRCQPHPQPSAISSIGGAASIDAWLGGLGASGAACTAIGAKATPVTNATITARISASTRNVSLTVDAGD
jgi:hypothetical protein